MTQFLPALAPAIDENGAALAGAKWRFFLEGTTTPQALSSGDTEATANASGVFSSLNLVGTDNRAILEDADGKVIFDISAVQPRFFSAAVKAAQSEAVIQSGAVWSFYTTGTTTPQPVYADPDLTVSLGAVVKADGNGRFPEIYTDDTITYKAVLSIGSTTIQTLDPANNNNQASYLTGDMDGIQYGPSAFFDAGTDGDYFVDAVNGDDANPGTSSDNAFATIQQAIDTVDAAGGDPVIRIMGDGVKYREEVSYTLNGAGVPTSLKITGYGTDKPIITGANVITGWTACTSSDSGVLGSNWDGVYKTTVNIADYPTPEYDDPPPGVAYPPTAPNYYNALMAEGDEPLTICGLRDPVSPVPHFHIDATDLCFRGDEYPVTFTTDASGHYETITHAAALGSYTDAQLARCVATLWHTPNLAGWSEVASVSSGVLTLETNDYDPQGNTGGGAYSLLNLLPNIQQGEWGYVNNGDGTVTFYAYPNDTASLTSGMEISVRHNGLVIYRIPEDVPLTIEGIHFEMSARRTDDGSLLEIGSNGSGITNQTTTIRECAFRNYAGEKALLFQFTQGPATLEKCSFKKAIGAGWRATGVSTARPTGYVVQNLLGQDLSQGYCSPFGVRNMIIRDCRAVRTSAGGHANLINVYQGCDKVVIQNFQCEDSSEGRPWAGYATNQRSSNIVWLHCTFTPGDDGRAYDDQTNTGTPNMPNEGEGGYIVNCWAVDHIDRRNSLRERGGFHVGPGSFIPWLLYNNVTPAIYYVSGTVIDQKSNLLTYSTTAADASEQVIDAEDLFADAANFDYTAVQAPLTTGAGATDATSVIELIEGWFPGEDFRRDALGLTWDPADPGYGPFGKNWNGGIS